MTDAFDEVAKHIGKDVPPSERNRLLDAAAAVVRPIGQMQQRLKDWDKAADDWIKDFHDDLSNYARVYATDVMERSSIGSAQFALYLRKQFAGRLESTRSMRGGSATLFSRPVLRAIERTGWDPDPDLWGPCKESQTPADTGLEIVRVLIRPLATVDQGESDALHVLHLDHRLHGIPLFVIDSDRLEPETRADFAIGLGETGSIRRCYEYLRDQGEVRGVPKARAEVLAGYFERMLDDRTLMTVPEFLGNVMISDPEESKRFTAKYDELRVASARIIDFIRDRTASAPKEAGLDIGCGTGNYTVPLLQDFEMVYGIDINEEMLRIARDKSKNFDDRLVLKRADAVKLPLDNESVGAVWSVSSLHYLRGMRQYYCLSEAYRVLKPGGRMVMDVGEFLEQHPSLWVVHYFPSLVRRYAGSLHSVDYYESVLREIGFEDVKCVSLEYTGDESDYVLRSGQHDPDRYLDQRFVAAIPAFRAMSRAELREGQERIRRDRDRGELEAVMAGYKAKAKMGGDLGFIVASRP
jgi:ubiquinone/menaquinone biosynthesis C-methylase UbiE